MYVGSIRDFKGRYYLVRPFGEKSVDLGLLMANLVDDEGLPVLDDQGEPEMVWEQVFPFH